MQTLIGAIQILWVPIGHLMARKKLHQAKHAIPWFLRSFQHVCKIHAMQVSLDNNWGGVCYCRANQE